MLNSDFNESFKNIHYLDKDSETFLQNFYQNSQPVYLEYDLDNVVEQIKSFKLSKIFEQFKLQYHRLLAELSNQCEQLGILKTFTTEELQGEIGGTSFDVFNKRLFERSFFSGREYLLFTETKKELEEIVALLANNAISSDIKKTSLEELQGDLLACADGSLSKIAAIRRNFAGYLSSDALLINLKYNIIRELIRDKLSLSVDKEMEEIHFINAYFNCLAVEFGLNEVPDAFATGLDIDAERIIAMNNHVFQAFTPTLVVEALLTQVDADLQQSFEKLHKFHESESSVNWQKTKESVEQELDSLNTTYKRFIQLDLNDFIAIDPITNKVSISSFKDKQQLVRLKVVRGFNFNYLTATRSLEFALSEDACLFLQDSTISFRLSTIEKVFSFKKLANYLPRIVLNDSNTAVFLEIIDTALEVNLAPSDALKQTLMFCSKQALPKVFTTSKINIIKALLNLNLLNKAEFKSIRINEKPFIPIKQWLIENGHASLINFVDPSLLSNTELQLLNQIKQAPEEAGIILAENAEPSFILYLLIKPFVAISQLSELMKTHVKAIALIRLLIRTNQLKIITEMINANLISSSCITSDYLGEQNLLEYLVNQKQLKLIDDLILQNLISVEYLDNPNKNSSERKSLLWMLAAEGHFTGIKHLIERDVLKPHHLDEDPSHSLDEGKNLLWLIIYHEQWELFETLIKLALVNSSQFIKHPQLGGFEQINCLHLLCFKRQYALVEQLISHKIINQQNFPKLGKSVQNFLIQLIDAKQFTIIELLLELKYIVSEHLIIRNTPLDYFMLFLTYNDRFKAIELVLDQKLVTPDHIAVASTFGPMNGVNTLLCLINNNRYDWVTRLLDENLVESRHLKAASSIYYVRNALLELTLHGQYAIIERLLEKNLLLPENFDICQSGPLQGVNALYGFVNQGKFELVERLIKKGNILKPEHFSAVCPQGQAKGCNTVGLIINTNITLFNQLIEEKLIIPEHFNPFENRPNRSCLQFLIEKKYYNEIEILINRNLIASQNLNQMTGKYNFIYVLYIKKRFDLINTLIEQGNLLAEHVSVIPPATPPHNKNLLQLLIEEKHYFCIKSLLLQNRVVPEHLSLTPASGVNWLRSLAFNQQYDLIKLFFSYNLIRPEHMLSSPISHINSGKNCLWLFIAHERFDLVKALIENNLVTKEQLLMQATSGDNQGLNSLNCLVNTQQSIILLRLLELKVISTSDLPDIKETRIVLPEIYNNQINRISDSNLSLFSRSTSSEERSSPAEKEINNDTNQYRFNRDGVR